MRKVPEEAKGRSRAEKRTERRWRPLKQACVPKKGSTCRQYGGEKVHHTKGGREGGNSSARRWENVILSLRIRQGLSWTGRKTDRLTQMGKKKREGCPAKNKASTALKRSEREKRKQFLHKKRVTASIKKEEKDNLFKGKKGRVSCRKNPPRQEGEGGKKRGGKTPQKRTLPIRRKRRDMLPSNAERGETSGEEMGGGGKKKKGGGRLKKGGGERSFNNPIGRKGKEVRNSKPTKCEKGG